MAPLVLAGAAVGLTLVLLVMIVVLLRGTGGGTSDEVAVGDPSVSASRSPTPSTPVASDPSPTQAAPTQPAPTETPVAGDVGSLPPGLLCRDLVAQGYSYTASVDYWSLQGQPAQMDADGNGIPCETVYPAGEVSAYWEPRDVPVAGDFPPDLFCRDLAAQGYSYADAVAYWWSYGAPERMDADGNGIPCETVYPAADVTAFWSP